MLSPANRLRYKADFAETIRLGRRVGRRDFVLYVLEAQFSGHDGPAVAMTHAPRAGLVVGKQVGGSVVRKQVSRRLRVALRGILPELPQSSRLVVRALPTAKDAEVSALARQIKSALEKLAARHTDRRSAT